MRFNVSLLRQADRDYRILLEFIAKRSKPGATAWARAFDKALQRLEESADSMPLAPEDEFVDFEVREILFKTRRGLVYRALFTIQDANVYIHHTEAQDKICWTLSLHRPAEQDCPWFGKRMRITSTPYSAVRSGFARCRESVGVQTAAPHSLGPQSLDGFSYHQIPIPVRNEW